MITGFGLVIALLIIQIYRQEKLMVTIADLDAAITSLEGTETTAAAAITAALNDLTAKLNSVPGNPVDATPEIARIKAVADALNQVSATATTDDPGTATTA